MKSGRMGTHRGLLDLPTNWSPPKWCLRIPVMSEQMTDGWEEKKKNGTAVNYPQSKIWLWSKGESKTLTKERVKWGIFFFLKVRRDAYVNTYVYV